MLRIVNYCVLKNMDEDELRDQVLELVREGWEPQGGVSCAQISLDNSHGDATWYYVQAMVKRPAA